MTTDPDKDKSFEVSWIHWLTGGGSDGGSFEDIPTLADASDLMKQMRRIELSRGQRDGTYLGEAKYTEDE